MWTLSFRKETSSSSKVSPFRNKAAGRKPSTPTRNRCESTPAAPKPTLIWALSITSWGMIEKLGKLSGRLQDFKAGRLFVERRNRSKNITIMARNDNSIETIQKTLDLAGQELRILHQISQSISSTLDLDQVLRQIVDLVIDF